MNNCENVTISEMMEKVGDFEITETKLVCTPTSDQPRAVVMVTILVDGKAYSALGEASVNEDSEITKNSVVCVAETRALARALRWATKTSTVAKEEIPTVRQDSGGTSSEPEVGILPDGTRSCGHWPENQEKMFIDLAEGGYYSNEDEDEVDGLMSDIKNNKKIKGSDYYDLIKRMKKERERKKSN